MVIYIFCQLRKNEDKERINKTQLTANLMLKVSHFCIVLILKIFSYFILFLLLNNIK